jgi:hypothetical protein
MHLGEGWICQPVVPDAESEPSAEVKACAATLGAYVCPVEFGHQCFIVCTSGSDDECGGGTYCEPQYHVCVWPDTEIPWPSTTGPEQMTGPDSTGTSTG